VPTERRVYPYINVDHSEVYIVHKRNDTQLKVRHRAKLANVQLERDRNYYLIQDMGSSERHKRYGPGGTFRVSGEVLLLPDTELFIPELGWRRAIDTAEYHALAQAFLTGEPLIPFNAKDAE
jgi:hypothetical protein